jgi:osmotically inducible protein OsmC
MSLASLLTDAGHPALELRTTADVTLAAVGGGYDFTRIALTNVGRVPGVGDAVFADLAGRAKNCTISRALRGTEITLEASLAAG